MSIKGKKSGGKYRYVVTLIPWAGPVIYANSSEELANDMVGLYLSIKQPVIPHEITLDGAPLSEERVEEMHAEWVSRTRKELRHD